MSAQPDRLTVRDDQMVFAIPSEQNGVEEIIYAVDGDDVSRALGLDPRRQRAKLGGAWKHVDRGAETDRELEQIENEHIPSQPIEDIP